MTSYRLLYVLHYCNNSGQQTVFPIIFTCHTTEKDVVPNKTACLPLFLRMGVRILYQERVQLCARVYFLQRQGVHIQCCLVCKHSNIPVHRRIQCIILHMSLLHKVWCLRNLALFLHSSGSSGSMVSQCLRDPSLIQEQCLRKQIIAVSGIVGKFVISPSLTLLPSPYTFCPQFLDLF